MPLVWEIRPNHAIARPIVVCDQCLTRVRTIGDGFYAFDASLDLPVLVFLHWPCEKPWLSAQSAGRWGRGDLATLWTMLRNNTGQTEAEARTAAVAHARLTGILGAVE